MALNVYKLTIVNRARWCETSNWVTSRAVELLSEGALGEQRVVAVERYDADLLTFVVVAPAASVALELAIASANE